MGTSSITPCYDAERLETKTHMGLDPGEPIEYTKHKVSLEGHPWPGCHPVSHTWRPCNYGQTKQKKGLKNISQVNQYNPEDCYLSRKDSGLQGGDIQVVNPYKCGRQGPAGHLTNVWNGHPAGPCPGRGNASGRMGSDSDEGTATPRRSMTASTNHLEIICFVTGPPLARLPKPTKSSSDYLFKAECSMHIFRVLTGQQCCAEICSSALKGSSSLKRRNLICGGRQLII